MQKCISLILSHLHILHRWFWRPNGRQILCVLSCFTVCNEYQWLIFVRQLNCYEYYNYMEIVPQ